MCDNRTSEFQALARSLPDVDRISSTDRPLQQQARQGTASSLAKDESTKSNPAYAELRNFHKTAGDISRDIASTSALLAELTRLVRQDNQSLFLTNDDSSTNKMNQLVVRIKTSIENLNARLDQASAAIAMQKRKLGKDSQAGQEASNLVDGLKTEFAEAASGFKKVLQQRTDTLKEKEDMQRQVYGATAGDDLLLDDNPMPQMSALASPPPVYSSAPPSMAMGGGAASGMTQQQQQASFPTIDLTSGMMMSTGEATGSGSTLPRPHGIAAAGGGAGYASETGTIRNRRSSSGDVPTYSGGYSTYERSHSTPLTPLDIQRMEEETGASQMMQLIPDQDYLQQRADAMSTVESQIVELGTVFNKLAVMVSEHQDLVQRVEDNVDDANANINLSLNVLTDTLTSLRTNRALTIKVFSILVAFIIFFIVFFA